MWPLFLLTTYFFTCSYYPWFSALTVLFLNFPNAFTVLASGGDALQLSFQGVGEVAQESYFESDTERAEISSLRTPGRSVRRLDSMESQSIINRVLENRSEPLDDRFLIHSPVERLPYIERSQARDQDAVTTQQFGDTSVPYAPRGRVLYRTQDQFSSSSSSEESAEPSDDELSDERRITGRTEAMIILSTGSEEWTAPRDSRLLTRFPETRLSEITEFQSLPSTSFQQKMPSTDNQVTFPFELEMPGTSKQTYIKKAKDHEEISQKSARKVQLTAEEEVRRTGIENEGTDAPVSTAEKSFFGDWRRRLGYCGHCGFHDNLRFRQDFTQLREPYQTRSGYIYGPIRRLLKLPDWLKFYYRR